jgi:iron complex transport system substrate-binding protein
VELDGRSSGEVDAAVRAALRDQGSVYEIDVPGITALEPDLVLTQGICDVCAVPEKQVHDALQLSTGNQVLTLDAHDLSAIFQSIRDVGRATGTSDRAERLVADMQRRIDAVRARTAGRPRPRVLALEWLDPPYVPGHWVPELIEAAGGDLVAGTAHQPSYRVEWDELRSLKPDVVLVIPCGFDRAAARLAAQRHDALLRSFGATVHCLDASAYFSRSGPRVVDGVELLSEIL